MRNMVRILTVGALVGWLSGGLTYAEDVAGPKFTVKASAKAVVAGGTITVEVGLSDYVDLAAFQFQMKATGGTEGTLKVVDIVMNSGHADYIFGPSDIQAVDKNGAMRAGGVMMQGGRSGESASVATVTFQASENAKGSFLVGVAENQETFLRDSTAAPIAFTIGQAVTITVRGSVTPTDVKKRRKSR